VLTGSEELPESNEEVLGNRVAVKTGSALHSGSEWLVGELGPAFDFARLGTIGLLASTSLNEQLLSEMGSLSLHLLVVLGIGRLSIVLQRVEVVLQFLGGRGGPLEPSM